MVTDIRCLCVKPALPWLGCSSINMELRRRNVVPNRRRREKILSMCATDSLQCLRPCGSEALLSFHAQRMYKLAVTGRRCPTMHVLFSMLSAHHPFPGVPRCILRHLSFPLSSYLRWITVQVPGIINHDRIRACLIVP